MADNKKKKVTKNYKGKAKEMKKVPLMNGAKADFIEYRMGKECMQSILEDRKAHGTPDEKKMDVQDYLCKYVDEQYGLLGQCVKVVYA